MFGVLASVVAMTVSCYSMSTVEPVFANIQNKGMRRFTLRGQRKVALIGSSSRWYTTS